MIKKTKLGMVMIIVMGFLAVGMGSAWANFSNQITPGEKLTILDTQLTQTKVPRPNIKKKERTDPRPKVKKVKPPRHIKCKPGSRGAGHQSGCVETNRGRRNN